MIIVRLKPEGRRARLVGGAALWAFAPLLLQPGCSAKQEDFNTLTQRGLTAQDEGRYTDALAYFNAAAEQDRERPEPSYYLGRCYLEMAGRKFTAYDLPGALRYCDRAVASFDDAMTAFPGYSRAIQGKADALRLRGLHEAALAVTDWAAAYAGPQAKMLILQGRTYAQAGDMDKAQLSFKQAAAMEPSNAAAHAELGLFYMRCGNEPAARQSLNRAYELDPGKPEILSALARLGAESGPQQ